MIRIASVLCCITAIGFGLPAIYGIWSLRVRGEIPLLLGYPSYGGGGFERMGVATTVPLLFAFLVVCTLEGVAGWLLWGGQRSGAILALATLPVGAMFWFGFSLPLPPLFAAARTALILSAWP